VDGDVDAAGEEGKQDFQRMTKKKVELQKVIKCSTTYAISS
jgi:hypothetical protein